jgi:hypothetical protein
MSSLTGNPVDLNLREIPKIEESISESVLVKKPSKAEVEKVMSVEEYVNKYFSDIPIMVHIAKCESTFKHLEDNGEVRRGKVNKLDVGVMQINEFYHLDQAINKDIDIYTIEGNLAYARDLYRREGTTPWNSSKPCWGKYNSDEHKDIAMK